MFKFDNAFLTKNKQVGMQFLDRSIKDVHGEPRKATLYPDHKGQLKLDVSVLDTAQEEYVYLVEQYNKKNHWYYKNKKKVVH